MVFPIHILHKYVIIISVVPLKSPTATRLGVFGGESTGFAHGVETAIAKSFYSNGAVPDQFGVAFGMKAVIPRSIFNRYALFNFRVAPVL